MASIRDPLLVPALLALLAPALLVPAAPALAGPECFIGTWVGDIDRLKSAEGPGRRLIVRSVAEDGTAKAQWGFSRSANPPAVADAKVTEGKLRFLSGPGSKVEISCSGPTRLTGSWVHNSRNYFFDLAKQP